MTRPTKNKVVKKTKHFKKIPKVKLDLMKEDFSIPFHNLYQEESPEVIHEGTFKKIASDYIINNIKNNNISLYFKTIKDAVQQTVKDFKEDDSIKFKLIITCEFTTPLAFDIIEAHYNHPFQVLLTMNSFDDIYSSIEENFIAWLDEFQERGSGFVFNQITKTNIRLAKTNQLRGSSYFPHDLGRRNSILNIQNKDQKCFLWSVIAKLYPPTSTKHSTRVSNYTPYENSLDMTDIEYPVKINDISKFERQNSNISISVFALSESNNINSIYPIYYNYSNYKNREHKIDLLYIEKDHMTHYFLIKNLESLLNNNRNQAFICRNCMSIFSTTTALGNHEEKCIEHKLCKLILPKEGKKIRI